MGAPGGAGAWGERWGSGRGTPVVRPGGGAWVGCPGSGRRPAGAVGCWRCGRWCAGSRRSGGAPCAAERCGCPRWCRARVAVRPPGRRRAYPRTPARRPCRSRSGAVSGRSRPRWTDATAPRPPRLRVVRRGARPERRKVAWPGEAERWAARAHPSSAVAVDVVGQPGPHRSPRPRGHDPAGAATPTTPPPVGPRAAAATRPYPYPLWTHAPTKAPPHQATATNPAPCHRAPADPTHHRQRATAPARPQQTHQSPARHTRTATDAKPSRWTAPAPARPR